MEHFRPLTSTRGSSLSIVSRAMCPMPGVPRSFGTRSAAERTQCRAADRHPPRHPHHQTRPRTRTRDAQADDRQPKRAPTLCSAQLTPTPHHTPQPPPRERAARAAPRGRWRRPLAAASKAVSALGKAWQTQVRTWVTCLRRAAGRVPVHLLRKPGSHRSSRGGTAHRA